MTHYLRILSRPYWPNDVSSVTIRSRPKVGLPPSYAEVVRFAQDPSDKAWAAMVDQLLASPEFGERWAQHWLDIARFGESDGFEYNQPREQTWHYRDWVIRTFSQDLPYDQFTRMQLADDVIDGPTMDGSLGPNHAAG